MATRTDMTMVPIRTASNNVTTALVDFAVATLALYRDVGVLQVRPDGMWEKGPDAIRVTHSTVTGPR